MNTYNGNSNKEGNSYQQGNFYPQGAPYQNGAYNNFNNQFGGYNENRIPRKAPNVFKQFFYSFVPSKYGNFASVGAGGMIGFVTLLTFVATLILIIRVWLSFLIIGGIDTFLNVIPDFEIRNGRFSIEEEFYMAKEDSYFYFTDQVDEFTYDDIKELRKEGYTEILLISRDNLAMYQDNEYQEHYFSDLVPNTTTVNKSWITDVFMPMIWIAILIGMLFFFIGRTFWYFACAAMYLLVGFIIADVLRKNVSAGNLFRTAVYAKVVMFVAVPVLSWIPFGPVVIPGILKASVRFVVTVIFMAFAIQYMPQNR